MFKVRNRSDRIKKAETPADIEHYVYRSICARLDHHNIPNYDFYINSSLVSASKFRFEDVHPWINQVMLEYWAFMFDRDTYKGFSR